MNPLQDLVPEAVVRALGWTLLHSLWQGALLAVLLSVLMLVLHRHTAHIRYRVAAGSLLLLLLTSVITFWQVYEPTTYELAVANLPAGVEALPAQVTELAPAEDTSWWASVTGQFEGYFSQHLPLLVTVWLLGLTVMLLRLLGGLAYTRRLKTYQLKPLALEWEQRVQALGRQLGLQKMVRLAESGLVKVPAVVGHLQPIILLPLGTAAGLSAAQLEAILAHELAHVSRHDYLLNLLQCVVEALFFFHPAVWWMSDCIRAEREHCCDDLAISLCGNSLTYAYALTNLEEILMKKPVDSPQLAVAFSGKKRSLLSRIKRLVQGPAVRPSFSEGFVAACVLMAGVLLFSVSAMANWGTQHEQDDFSAVSMMPGDSGLFSGNEAENATFAAEYLPEGEGNLNEEELTQAQHITIEDKDLIIVRNKKGKIVELYVNGQKIPKGQISEYQTEIDASLNRSKSATRLHGDEEVSRAMNSARSALGRVENRNRGIHFDFDFDSDNAPAPPAPPMPPLPIDAVVGIAATAPFAPIPPVPPVPPLKASKSSARDKEQYKREMKQYEADMKEYEKDMKVYEKDMQGFEKQMERYGEEMGRFGEAFGEQIGRRAEVFAERIAASAERATRIAEAKAERVASNVERGIERGERNAQAAQMRAEEHARQAEEHASRAEQHEEVMETIREELAEDDLVSENASKFSFKLGKDGLYVNGQKQSDALYKKYKKLVTEANGQDMDIEMRKDNNTYSISTNED